MTWCVPRCFEGGTVAVLASGPSMAQAVADQVHEAGIPAIAVNNTFRLAPWAWMLYAADPEWWKANPDALKFDGIKASCGDQIKGVYRLRNTGKEGFDPDPGAVRTGGNSGYQAVHIAAHAGASRILLCGFDMKGGHWHPEHESPLRTTHMDTYGVWALSFEALAAEMRARKIEVLNCASPTNLSALTCFPMVSLDEVVR